MIFDSTSYNKVLPQWGGLCFHETFVLVQNVAHLLSFSVKTPPLRQYPNRYRQVKQNKNKDGL